MYKSDHIKKRVELEANARQGDVVSRLFMVLQRRHEKSANGVALKCGCSYCSAVHRYVKAKKDVGIEKKRFERYLDMVDSGWYVGVSLDELERKHYKRMAVLEKTVKELQEIKNGEKNCFL